MKTPTDKIHQLIHSMTAAEKRYFKRHYSTKESHATQLFDFINKQSKYDETLIKEHFSESKLSKNLKVHKAQLARQLIKSLQSYHNKKNVRSKIRNGLEEIEILMSKQLFEMAHARLIKLKKLCLKSNQYDYFYAIVVLEVHFDFFYSADSVKQQKFSLFNELQSITNTLQSVIQLNHNYNALKYRLESIEAEPLTDREKKAYLKTLREHARDEIPKGFQQVYNNLITAWVFELMADDFDSAVILRKHNIDYFQQYPKLIENAPVLYWTCNFEYIQSAITQDQPRIVDEKITELRNWVKKNSAFEKNLLSLDYLELQYAFRQKKYTWIIAHSEPRILDYIEKNSSLKSIIALKCLILLALTHLTQQHKDHVNEYLKIINENYGKPGRAYFQFSKIMDWMILYELHNLKRLDKNFKYDSKNQRNIIIYEEIKIFFDKLVESNNLNLKAHFQSLLDFLKIYEQSNLLKLLKSSYFIDWLHSKSIGKSFTDYLRDA